MTTIRENAVIPKGDIKSVSRVDGSSMATKGQPMETVNMFEITR